MNFESSEGFFNYREPLARAEVAGFSSIRGRVLALIRFFKMLITLPVALVYKSHRTAFSFLGVGISVAALLLTLCNSSSLREFFIKKVTKLAKDLADWFFWPFAVVLCLSRLLLAAFIHPALYFRAS